MIFRDRSGRDACIEGEQSCKEYADVLHDVNVDVVLEMTVLSVYGEKRVDRALPGQRYEPGSMQK